MLNKTKMNRTSNTMTDDNKIGATIECLLSDCESNGYLNKTDYNLTTPLEYVCMSESRPEDRSIFLFHISIYITYGIIFVIALIGNGLVCYVVQTAPQMKTVTNFFIINLAVGDILMTIFCVPFSFVSMLILRYWPFGELMCKLVHYSQAVSVLVSAYTLLTISIDRYFVVTRPLKPRIGKTVAKLAMCLVWCGALTTASPILIVSQLDQPTLWHEVCELVVCREKWSSPDHSQLYTYALLILQFALPLTALIFSYGRIVSVVWGNRPPGEAESVRDMRMQNSKRKMVKMMITVVMVFTVCWLPLNVFIILWTAYQDNEEWTRWSGMPYVWFITHCLAMSHSCYNPIIYCYMNVRYRSGFVEALSKLLHLNKNSGGKRTCHRSSVCERIPLSDFFITNRCSSQRVMLIRQPKLDQDGLYSIELNRKSTSCPSLRTRRSNQLGHAASVGSIKAELKKYSNK